MKQPIWDEEIIVSREAEHCASYGFDYDNDCTSQTIFCVGGMIADDSFHTIGIHAMPWKIMASTTMMPLWRASEPTFTSPVPCNFFLVPMAILMSGMMFGPTLV
jgi:hypothetical protein